MAIIKGKGIPSRETKGAIGDTYINVLTGIKYKCVDSYKISGMNSETVYCNWKRMGVEQQTGENKTADKNKVQPVPEATTNEQTVAPEQNEEEINEESEAEVEESDKNEKPNHVNYAAAYNLKNK